MFFSVPQEDIDTEPVIDLQPLPPKGLINRLASSNAQPTSTGSPIIKKLLGSFKSKSKVL